MIVVTAPTSNIGRRVLEHLAGGGEAVRVIARNPDAIPEALRERVEVVEGSHNEADVVDRAFAGADTVFWLCPADPKAPSVEAAYVGFTRPAAEAFEARGVSRVVGITALGRGTPVEAGAGYVSGSLAMDDLIAATGVSYAGIANPSFMDNVARQAEAIRTKGMFFGPVDADLKAPTCAVRDIAAVAVEWLLDRSWSGVHHAAVLGPEDLSFNDMARIMSEVLGREIRYGQVGLDAFRDQFLGFGYSAAMAQGMADMMRAKNEGLDNGEPRTAGNSTPTTFRQWCEEELKPRMTG